MDREIRSICIEWERFHVSKSSPKKVWTEVSRGFALHTGMESCVLSWHLQSCSANCKALQPCVQFDQTVNAAPGDKPDENGLEQWSRAEPSLSWCHFWHVARCKTGNIICLLYCFGKVNYSMYCARKSLVISFHHQSSIPVQVESAIDSIQRMMRSSLLIIFEMV